MKVTNIYVTTINEDNRPVEEAAGGPLVGQEQVDGEVEEEHGHWVVEQSQHVYGVDAIGRTAHEEEHIGRHLVDKTNTKHHTCNIYVMAE